MIPRRWGRYPAGRVDTPASPVNPREDGARRRFPSPTPVFLAIQPSPCLPVRTRLSWLTTLHTDGRVRRCVQILSVLRALEREVVQHPEYPWMENGFDGIVHNMMQVVDTPDLLSLSLAPMARTAKVFPLAGNEGDIGLDSMNPCQVRCQGL